MRMILARVAFLVVVMAIAGALAAWVKADFEKWNNTVIVFDDKPIHKQVVVKPGDTVWGLASKHIAGNHAGQKVYELHQANPWIGPSNIIKPGQVVVIP